MSRALRTSLIIGICSFICVFCSGVFSYGAEDTGVDVANCQHQYTVTIEKYATATEDGLRRYTCKICGSTYTESIPLTGHIFEKTYIPPTCTESGYVVYTCTKCGETHREIQGSSLGHSFGEWIVTKEPTSQSEGTAYRVCANDSSHIEEKVLPVLTAVDASSKDNTAANTTTKVSGGTTDKSHSDYVPWSIVDFAIIGGNIVTSLMFIFLLIPYFIVLLWIKRKKKEILEEEK